MTKNTPQSAMHHAGCMAALNPDGFRATALNPDGFRATALNPTWFRAQLMDHNLRPGH
jgi:hypothetical protein